MRNIYLTMTLLLALLLAACVPTTAPDGAMLDDSIQLNGTEWELVGYGDPNNLTALVPGSQITLTFDAENAGGSAGCNSYGGGYTLTGSQLSFGEIAITAMACVDNAVMQQENAYTSLLWQTESFTVSLDTVDGRNTLTLSSPEATLVFQELVPLALTDNPWQLSGMASGVDAVVSTWVDELITLTFADGMVTGSAGCNNLSASYTVDGSGLTFGPVATTKMLCDEERNQREAELLAALAQVTGYTTTYHTLTLTGADGAMLLTFRPLSEPQPAGLYGRVWRVISLETPAGPLPVQSEKPITAQFLQEHIWGDGVCHIYAAPVRIVADDYLMLVSEIGRTPLPCTSDETQLDTTYFEMLADVNAFTIDGDDLTLYTAAGAIHLAAMAVTEYMPRFVALDDGRLCTRLDANGGVAVAGETASYTCTGSGELYLLGGLQPDGDGWRATLAEVSRGEAGETINGRFEVFVMLPRR